MAMEIRDMDGKILCVMDVPDDASSVDPPEGSNFLKMIRCRACKEWSFGPNPLTKGRYCPDGNLGHQFRPWLHGTQWAPSSKFCKISMEAFLLGRFNANFPTLQKMVEHFDLDATLFPQLMACENKYIELVNSGSIGVIVRGPTRAHVEEALAAVRKKVVTSFQTKLFRDRIPMRAMTVKRYKEVKGVEQIPATLRRDKNHVWPDGTIRDTVWVKALHEDEMESMLDLDTGFKFQEVLDDGTDGTLREDQQEAEFDLRARDLNGLVTTDHDAAVTSAASAGQLVEEVPTPLPEEQNIQEDEEGEYQASGPSSLVSRLISHAQTPAPARTGAAPRGVASATSGRNASAVNHTTPRSTGTAVAPQTSPRAVAGRTADKPPAGIRAPSLGPALVQKVVLEEDRAGLDTTATQHKLEELPLEDDVAKKFCYAEPLKALIDIKRSLQGKTIEGKSDTDNKAIAEAAATLQVPNIEGADTPTRKKYSAFLTGLAGKANVVYKNIVCAENKINKRANVAESVKTVISQIRLQSNTVNKFLTLMLENAPEYGKLLEISSKMRAFMDGTFPVGFRVRISRASAIDNIRIQRAQAAIVTMGIDPAGALKKACFSTETVQCVNAGIIQSSNAYFLESFAKGQRSRPRNLECFRGIVCLATTVSETPSKKILHDGDLRDLELLIECGQDVPKAKQEAAVAKLAELKKDIAYNGILFAFLNHPNYPLFKEIADMNLAAKQSKDEIVHCIVELVDLLNQVDAKLAEGLDPCTLTSGVAAQHDQLLLIVNAKLMDVDAPPLAAGTKVDLERCIGIASYVCKKLLDVMDKGLGSFVSISTAYVKDGNSSDVRMETWYTSDCSNHIKLMTALNLTSSWFAECTPAAAWLRKQLRCGSKLAVLDGMAPMVEQAKDFLTCTQLLVAITDAHAGNKSAASLMQLFAKLDAWRAKKHASPPSLLQVAYEQFREAFDINSQGRADLESYLSGTLVPVAKDVLVHSPTHPPTLSQCSFRIMKRVGFLKDDLEMDNFDMFQASSVVVPAMAPLWNASHITVIKPHILQPLCAFRQAEVCGRSVALCKLR